MPAFNQFIKFLTLTLGVLMLVSAIANIIWDALYLAVASAILSAYALNIFFDTYKTELIDAVNPRREDP